MDERARALVDICRRSRPCTVRQVFYQATVLGILDKTEASYNKVQRQLVDLRRAGIVPFSWLTDNTRFQRKPLSYDGLTAAVEHTRDTYRKALWSDLNTYVEVWLEKDALSGVLYPITSRYDVPLMVARGYSSLTFLHEAAAYMRDLDKRVVILHFGDHDPSGRDAADKIETTLREFAPEVEIEFHRCAVTPAQIEACRLPSRPTKVTDSRSRTWTGGDSVELDAIEANLLRQIAEMWIEALIPEGWLAAIRAAEESERMLLARWARLIAPEAGS